MTPTSTWGRQFVTTPLASRLNGDTFRFLAATDGTEVRVNGALVATLNAGQVHEQILTTSSHIEATQPVLVAQFANGSSFSGNPGDPFMMIVPPYEQFLNSYTVTTPASGFVQSYVSVVAPGNGAGITLDGRGHPDVVVHAGRHERLLGRLAAGRPRHAPPVGGAAVRARPSTASTTTTPTATPGGLGLSEVASVIQASSSTPETGTAAGRYVDQCVTGRALRPPPTCPVPGRADGLRRDRRQPDFRVRDHRRRRRRRVLLHRGRPRAATRSPGR